jgi:WD40 repeat protein
MADVFISYAREDIDFVISPDSLASQVCGQELDRAALHNKRIIAVVRRDPDTHDGKPLSVPEALGKINRIFGRETDSFDEAVRQVVESLDTDLEHVRAHARLTVRAVEWEASGGDGGFLLRGRDLEDARRWLDESEGKEPEPSGLHREYIATSRQAGADAVAARTLVGFPEDPELGVLLAGAAVTELADTPAAIFAMRTALAASPLRALLRGHEGEVLGAEWSPDGSGLVTIGEDGTARVWDARTGAALSGFTGHGAPVSTVAWSPDGTRFLTYLRFSHGEAIRLWNAATGEGLAYLPCADTSQMWTAEWSQDGRWIVVVAGDVRLVDPDTGDVVRVFDPGVGVFSLSVSFSPEGGRALIGLESGVAAVWDVEGGGEPLLLRGNEARVQFGAWSPDGLRVLTVSDDATARVWSTSDGEPLSTLRGHEGPLRDARWSGDTRLILSRSVDHSARIWDAQSGDPIVRIGGIDDPVEEAEWQPESRRVLVRTATGAWVWDIDLEVEPLLAKARGRVSRRLTPEERRSFGIPMGAGEALTPESPPRAATGPSSH